MDAKTNILEALILHKAQTKIRKNTLSQYNGRSLHLMPFAKETETIYVFKEHDGSIHIILKMFS